MPELMISEEYRTQIKLQLQKEKNNQLQAELKKNTVPKELMDELLAKIERLEKYQKVSDV
jgi:DnaJ-domain-containing protein 1